MEVGDYVRTKSNGIQKIDDEGRINLGLIRPPFHMIKKEELLKSSPNIIDLIEVGDYVNYEQINGGVVLNKKENEIDTWTILPNSLKNEDIKSVITHEQLKTMQYKVESEVN